MDISPQRLDWIGLERKIRKKNHTKTGSYRKAIPSRSLAIEQDLQSHAFKERSLESEIIFPVLIFLLLLQNHWQHFTFPSLFIGMPTSLDTTVRLQFCFQNIGSQTVVTACPLIPCRRPVIVRAFWAADYRKVGQCFLMRCQNYRRFFHMQKTEHELSCFQKSVPLSALQCCV